MVCVTDMVLNFGQMVPDTRECGVMIKQMVKVNLYTLMEIYTKVSGSTIKLRVQALIHMRMEPITRANGKTISNMDMVLSLGQMVLDMKANTRMERKRDKDASPSQTEATTRVSSKRMRSLDLETIIGQMANHMLETGAKTKWMATVSSHGKTARNMRATL